MKSILEIPVFTAHPDQVDKWFSSNQKLSLKKYNKFVLFDFEITTDYNIYFYLLDTVPKVGSNLLLDQVVQKAPFSLIFVDQTEGIRESKTRQLFTDYLDKYSTPYFFLAKKNSQELYENLANDPIISDNDSAIILFNENDVFALKIALLDAIKVTLSKQHKK